MAIGVRLKPDTTDKSCLSQFIHKFAHEHPQRHDAVDFLDRENGNRAERDTQDLKFHSAQTHM